MKNEEFIASILKDVADVRWLLKLAATLNVGDRQVSIGKVRFSKTECAVKGDFWPNPGNEPETFPMNGGILKLKDGAVKLRLSQLQRHSSPFQNRLHFFYEVVDA